MIYKLFIFWRLGLLFITLIGSLIFSKIANGGPGTLASEKSFNYWNSLLQWDGGHYLAIAEFGYQDPQNYAFFPLYPLIIKTLSLVFENQVFWGLFISNLALLLFLVCLFNIIKKKYSPVIAFNTIVSFLVFPTAFFTTTFYTESLFLLLVAISFYSIERKFFLLTAFSVSLASLTRPVGVTLTISVFYRYLSIIKFNLKKINAKIIYPILSFSGISLYCLFLFTTTKDPIKFLGVQTSWGRFVSDPVTTIFFYYWTFLTSGIRPFMDYFDFSLTISFLIILAYGAKKIPSSLWIFSILVILIPASTGTLTSMPRYLLSSLGTFVIIGQLLQKNPQLKIPYWTLSLLLQIFLYIRFLNGYWVA